MGTNEIRKTVKLNGRTQTLVLEPEIELQPQPQLLSKIDIEKIPVLRRQKNSIDSFADLPKLFGKYGGK